MSYDRLRHHQSGGPPALSLFRAHYFRHGKALQISQSPARERTCLRMSLLLASNSRCRSALRIGANKTPHLMDKPVYLSLSEQPSRAICCVSFKTVRATKPDPSWMHCSRGLRQWAQSALTFADPTAKLFGIELELCLGVFLTPCPVASENAIFCRFSVP
jgi:hypothetical protein